MACKQVLTILILICQALSGLPGASTAQAAPDRPTSSTMTLSPQQERMRDLVRLCTYRHQLNLYAGPFLEMDADRDNVLTHDEARLQARKEARKRATTPAALEAQHFQFIKSLDPDDDRRATLKDLRAVAARKADLAVDDYMEQVVYDENKDGLIKGDELRKLAEKHAREKWKEEDSDSDGRWTVSEIFGKPTIEESAAHFKNEQIRKMQVDRWKAQWAELDTDKDGYATLQDRLRLYRQSPPKIASKYERRPKLNPDYTLFRERVRFAETGERSVQILKKYPQSKKP